jgi:ribosomal protein S18 acetylase RimI-like enzyme
MITISRRTEITQAGVEQLNVLMRELHSDADQIPLATLERTRAVLAEKNIVMVTVNDDEKIVGVASLYLMPKITKLVSHLEDVVVSSEYRGQGLGEKLVLKVIEIAKDLGVQSIALTSRPSRVAANKLYQKIGFIQKETNPYTIKL